MQNLVMRVLRIAATMRLVAVVVFFALLPARGEAAAAGRSIDHLSLRLEPKVLNPVREKNPTEKITLTAFYRDGSQRVLKPPSETVITAREPVGRTRRVNTLSDRITPEGGVLLKRNVPVTDRRLSLSIEKDAAVSVIPAGTKFSGGIKVSSTLSNAPRTPVNPRIARARQFRYTLPQRKPCIEKATVRTSSSTPRSRSSVQTMANNRIVSPTYED